MSDEVDAGWAKPARERSLLLLLAVLYLALSVSYSFIIPLGYGPDEPRHYAFIKRLVEKHRLPLSVNGVEEDGAIVLHPPLYYTLLAPGYILLRGLGDTAAQRGLRFLSPLLCGAALWLFYCSLRRTFPSRAPLRLGTLAVTALLPHLLLESSVINNDTLAILIGSLLLWQLARMGNRPPSTRESLLVGLALAAFVDTKATGITVSPLWAIWLLWQFGWRGLRRRDFWKAFFLGYGVMLLLGAWWYARNLVLYGDLVPNIGGLLPPIDMNTHRIYTPGELVLYGLLGVGPLWRLIGRAIGGLFLSVWTQVGWFPDALSIPFYAMLVALLSAACAGHLMGWIAVRRKSETTQSLYPPGARAMFPGFILIYANVVFMAVFVHIGFYQGGRYLLPAIWGFTLFLGMGWERLVGSARRQIFLFAGAAAFFLLLNLACLHNLIFVLNPLYGPKA